MKLFKVIWSTCQLGWITDKKYGDSCKQLDRPMVDNVACQMFAY